MFYAVATVAFVLLVIATIFDLRTREIPDWISIAIGIIATASSLTGWLELAIGWVLLGGLVGFAVGYALFRFAHFGGGDAKLIMAIGMLVGPVGLLIVLLGMAIFGGVLALVAMIRGQRDYAYVPAITAGFIGYVGLVSQLH